MKSRPIVVAWACAAAVCIVMLAPVARAQTPADTAVDSNTRWLAAGPTDFVGMRSSTIAPHFRAYAGLATMYQQRSVVLRRQDGTTFDAVDAQWELDILLAFGLFDQLQVGAAVPLTLLQSGVGVSPIVSSGGAEKQLDVLIQRDARFALDWRPPIGRGPDDEQGPGLLASFGLVAPIGDGASFATSDQWVYVPEVVGDWRFGDFLAGVNVGARIRPDTRALGAARFGSQLSVGVGGAWYPVASEKYAVTAEVTSLFELAGQPPESKESQHVYEMGAGFRWTPPGGGFSVRAGLSTGVGGAGAPLVRVLAGMDLDFDTTKVGEGDAGDVPLDEEF